MIKKNKNLQAIQSMQRNLDEIDFDFNQVARKVGFTQRVPKKIFPEPLCKALCLLTFQVRISLVSWATLLSLNLRNIVSSQAINKRINSKFVALIKMALAAVLQKNAQSEQLKAQGLFSKFKRVILQDSTTIKVSNHLFKWFLSRICG